MVFKFKKIEQSIFFFIFLFLCFGCNSNKKYEPSINLADSLFTKNTHFKSIDVLSANNPFVMDGIVKSYEFIPLQTTDESLFSYANNLVVNDSLIIINTISSVLFWDRQGKFLRRFQELGRGPGEYTSIHGFAVDFRNKKMAIADEISVNIYTLGGTFIRQVQLPEPPFKLNPNIIFLNSRYLLLENDRSLPFFENGYSPLWMIDVQTGESSPIFQNYPSRTKDFNQVYTFEGELKKTVDGVLYSATEAYNIYHIDKQYNPTLLYKLDFGKYEMPAGLLHDGFKYRDYRVLFTRLTDINISGKYLFVRYGINNGPRGINFEYGYFVFDIIEQKLLANQFHSPGLISSKYPEMYFWPKYIDKDNTLISLHWPEDLQEMKILPEVQKGDNPVLSFIKLQ